MSGLVITEGVSGVWHYHLSKPDSKTRAICGARVMHTYIALKDWKVPFGAHFPWRQTWCAECDKHLTMPG